LSGSGTCLSMAQGGYWLQISQSCIGKSFRVKCDKDFYTALLYKKSDSDIWYISSNTQAASANGFTDNKVVSLCFKQGSDCDYEGSLWAALALQSKNNMDPFLPYLIALAPDNPKYNPYAFLNKLAPSDEFLATLRSSQNPAGFWDLGSSYGRNYDTAISILGLASISDDVQLSSAKDWLISVQASDGCWQTVRDTALILYAAWPKQPASNGTGTGVSEDYCEDYGKYCMSNTDCINTALGTVLPDYRCRQDITLACCSNPKPEKTCTDKGGIVCNSDEECSGSLVNAQGTTRCCVDGTCAKQVTSGCEQSSYTCRSSCLSDEESKTSSSNDCPGSEICCGLKQTTTSYWWIWLLVILVVLVALGILFRNRIRLFLFNMRSGKGKSSVQQTRPPFPPSSPMNRMMPRMMPRPAPQPQPSKPAGKSKVDTELDDTLRKLRDMSK